MSFIWKAFPAILILMLLGPRLSAQSSPLKDEVAMASSSEILPQPGNLPSFPLFPPRVEAGFATPVEPAPFIGPAPDTKNAGGVQTERIAGFVPNFQAVSADVVLPPLSVKQKFALASRSTFDYSSFVFVGMQASIEQAMNTYPEFHHGEAAFARYYWHTFADQAVGNYITGAIFPALTHEDPRYYTQYHGNFLHRTAYAISRLWITRNDAGKNTFNYSEIVGTGVATGISNFYYPRNDGASLSGNGTRWAVQLLNDGITNIFEEFWPDINHKFFHERK